VPDSTTSSAVDERWMQQALRLARQSVGLASPNPAVGCVIVKGDHAVGQGFHEYDKRDHAEIVALREAGTEARGATAYVTLEPCSHTGRTGPCADALIAAGVARVVAATGDPNPTVNGRGLAKLHAAGIEVNAGVCAEAARTLNDGFARYIRTGLPFVTLKSGVTLDGRIAPAPSLSTQGKTFWITGEESRAAVQQMRHASDALVTGINTVLNDDPLLSDRSGLPRRRPLLRVVLDSALRIRLDCNLVRSAKDDVVVCCTTPIANRVRALEDLGVRVEQLDPVSGEGRVPLTRVLERLGEMQLTTVMLEAGTQVNSSALNLDLVDKVSLFIAPTFLGSKGVPLLHRLDDFRPNLLMRNTMSPSGPDFRFEGYIRDPWA
jgi:diaminohydroxyphosphoribosylaminopyrimidine deaminase/5-amino-6-(5-phosphoribosylamino)uracil reductase